MYEKMTDISSIGMVSYYNSLAMYRQQQQPTGQHQLAQQIQQQAQTQQAQQHSTAASADGGQQYWYGYPHGHSHAAHHQANGPQQYLDHADVISAWQHPHAHPYSHLQYQHPQAYQQQPGITGATDWSGDETNPPVVSGQPSPPITVSGSEISNPGTPSTPPSNNNNNNNNNNSITANNNTSVNNNNNSNNNSGSNNTTPMRPAQIRSPYEWMKKTSYQSQPNPACNITSNCNASAGSTIHELCTIDALGKTRTKDKYRVVYTDHQRLELEKEFHYSRYITIRRKAELAANLALSERQVKIWFQNRRAKERKQVKKREELEHKDPKAVDNQCQRAMASLSIGGMGGMLSGLMQNGGSTPLPLGHPSHALALSHATASLHSHGHQHPHPHTVIGL